MNKRSKDNNRRDASLHLTYKQQGFYEKCVGMHCIPTIVHVLFGPTIHTSVYLVAFYTYLCSFLNSITTEGHGIVSNVWHEAVS